MQDRVVQVDALLYGQDPTPRLVAVELANAQTIGLYRRGEDGRVEYATEEFTPWVLLHEAPNWPRLRDDYRVERLVGEAHFGWLVSFRSWSAYNVAREMLEQSGTSWEGFRSPV